MNIYLEAFLGSIDIIHRKNDPCVFIPTLELEEIP